MTENNNFKMGLRDGLPICLGYFAVSFAFGIFAVSSGLSILEAVLISAFNLTSAGQIAAVPIIACGGGLIELALSQLVINSRYALMSVSLSQRLSVKTADRFLIAYANTDEIFAVSVSKEQPVGRKFMFGLILPPFLGWTLGTLLGAFAGNILPAILVCALEIAIYAMFIAIVVPAAKDSGKVAIASMLAVGLSCVFYFVEPIKEHLSKFSIIIIAVLVSAFMALVAPIPDEDGGEEAKDA